MNLSVALRLGRVSNVPTVWTNVFTGVALAGAAAADEYVGPDGRDIGGAPEPECDG